MTQEEKQLLLKDLCARLPYEVKVQVKDWTPLDIELKIGHIQLLQNNDIEVLPYLRPMSSMTEEECITLSKMIPYEIDAWKYIKTPVPLHIANIEQFDFFYCHHLDWRGLIPKSLAIAVTKENNPYEQTN